MVIKHGLQFEGKWKRRDSYGVVLIEHDLGQLHWGTIFGMRMVNYDKMVDENVGHTHKMIRALERHFGHQNSDTVTTLREHFPFWTILTGLKSQVLAHHNHNQLLFNLATIIKQMLQEEYPLPVAFLFAVFWTYGSVLNDKEI